MSYSRIKANLKKVLSFEVNSLKPALIMNISILRQLWSLVETTQPSTLLNLDDESLVESLIGQLKAEHPLCLQEAQTVDIYIRSRTPLIRELAQHRLQFSPYAV
jgi:hypothetical protein